MVAGLLKGFAYALAGGATGFGEARMAELKQKAQDAKDLALRQLDQQFQSGLAAQERTSRETIAGAQLASTKELTRAQLEANRLEGEAQRATQERLVKVQEAGATGRTELTLDAEAKRQREALEAASGNLDKELRSRMKVALLGEKGATKRTDAQIAANQRLAEMQAAGPWQMTQVYNADGTTTRTILTNAAGEKKELPIDESTGKPLNPVLTDTDTDDARNYKFMISRGIDPTVAANWAFAPKTTNPLQEALLALKILNEGESAGIKSLTPDRSAANWAIAKDMTGYTGPMPGGAAAPVQPPGSVGVPSNPPPAPVPLLPDGKPDTAKMTVGQTYANPRGGTATYLGVVNGVAQFDTGAPSG